MLILLKNNINIIPYLIILKTYSGFDGIITFIHEYFKC
jgi:hypothetical protein